MKIQTGDRFGKLEVIGITDLNYNGRKRPICKCDCGNIVVVSQCRLLSGKTKSCGCLRKETCIQNAPTDEMRENAKISMMRHKISRNMLNEKYIYMTENGLYEVKITNRMMRTRKKFKTLGKAIIFRDEMYKQLQDKLNGGETNG